MTLAAFAQMLDRGTAYAQVLHDAVHTNDTEHIHDATLALSKQILAMQQALPGVLPLLSTSDPQTRKAWSERLETAAYLSSVGAELSSLSTADAVARLAALARASGADTTYASSGQLAL